MLQDDDGGEVHTKVLPPTSQPLCLVQRGTSLIGTQRGKQHMDETPHVESGVTHGTIRSSTTLWLTHRARATSSPG